jgi:hypothetical protein
MSQPDIATTSAANGGQPTALWTRLQMDCMVDLGLIIAERLYPETVQCRNKRTTGESKTNYSAVMVSAPLERATERPVPARRGDVP